MRGAPKSTKTDEQRAADKIAATKRWYLRNVVARVASGLTIAGTERKRAPSRLSPLMKKLVAEHKTRQAELETVEQTPLEKAWQAERASMGHIEIPDVQLRLRG